MPKAKYDDIFSELRDEIVGGAFDGGMLPTEAQLTERYGVSRNTVRRAIDELARLGLVQPIRGRGVVVLDRIGAASDVDLDIRDISGAQAISRSRHHETVTRILQFSQERIDAETSHRTSLPEGERVWRLERLRICDGHPWIIDHNWFLCDVVRDLTLDVAEHSIYRYVEEELGRKVIASRRTLAIQRADARDRANLELDGCDCVGVIYNSAFIDSGRLFEFTETHYSPEHFTFTEFISR